jgi:hypothetical protein
MKASKFSEAQIAFVLKQAEDGSAVAEVFVHDQLATGRKIRVLTIVDTFSRFSPGVDPRFSYRRRGRRADLGAHLQNRRLSQDDPRRPGIGVHLPRSRHLGLPEGCGAGFLAAG